jgi:selenide,water dikinase
LKGLVRSADPALLVGPETADDAGIYRLGDDLALVETADIITPLVDEPFTFGRIAAANALSDVYAMGGKPVTAMNLVFFPACTLPVEVLREILAGGMAALTEAGVCLVGGHTVEDDELKFGLAVTGTIHPANIVRNSTARPGDRLVLTKPLGTGIIATAIKAEMAPPETAAEAVKWMIELNAATAGLMLECGASACTDVTGFGLIGHAREMASGGGVTIRLERNLVPLIRGVAELVRDGLVPAGCYRNRDFYWEPDHREPKGKAARLVGDELLPLFDPQTSGGLLIAFAPPAAERFIREAGERGLFARVIGEVVDRRERLVEIN